MPLAPILLILAQASGPVVTPLVLPTTQDYALVALPPASTGAATVRITRRTGSDQLDCTPSAITGGTAIAVASCRLAMMKMGWMAAVKDRNGQDGTIPVVRLFWEPAPSTFQGDMGGATPIALDGKAPIASDPDKAATALQSDYTVRLDATGRPRSCRITQSSGTRRYDDTAGLVAMGQRYLPALDDQGRPRETEVKSWVRFTDR